MRKMLLLSLLLSTVGLTHIRSTHSILSYPDQSPMRLTARLSWIEKALLIQVQSHAIPALSTEKFSWFCEGQEVSHYYNGVETNLDVFQVDRSAAVLNRHALFRHICLNTAEDG